jgi:kynureninase
VNPGLDRDAAVELDRRDPLAAYRDAFHVPLGKDGEPLAYFAGNSLGLAPRAARARVDREMDDWARLGVEGHFRSSDPWYSYHEPLREPLARLVGARPSEVVAMNSLTVNIHLLLVTFYRPTPERHRILIEEHAFPSDAYAVQSQLRHHGYDPDAGVLVARARPGEATLRTDDLEALLEREGSRIAVVLLGAVNYFTGQCFDLERITAAAQRQGCVVGLDLAHAAGNVPLDLHDAGVDFAAWCSYKYLNAGPGAVAGAFVHERHAARTDLVRFAGWWGNDPATRFDMHGHPRFEPVAGADGWQLSNAPVLAMAPLHASLAIFDAAGMAALRAKSVALTGYLEGLVDAISSGRIEILTPRQPAARGCQLSLRVRQRPRQVFAALGAAGVVADFRDPDVIRVAPAPLYNSFLDAWRCADALAGALGR